MLIPVDPGPAIVACSTCRHDRLARTDAEGRTGGAQLIEALDRVKATDARYADIAVQAMPCLFACQDHCAVHLRAPGKIGYSSAASSPMKGRRRRSSTMPFTTPPASMAVSPMRCGPKG